MVESLPKISIVVPSYQQGQFIEDTILSLLGQGYPRLEVIIIDGGSEDETIDILDAYKERLAYWHSRPDKGQADAINQGVKRATGDIISWLNSDDFLMPGTLLDVGKRFFGRTEERLLLHGGVICMLEEELLRCWTQDSEPINPEKLTYVDFIQQPATFWTRALWDSAGPLEEKYHYVLDWEWYIRASRVGTFEYVPKFFAVYRHHKSHKTGTGRERRREEIRQVVAIYSDSYWQCLYEGVEDYYPAMKAIARRIQKMRISNRNKRRLLGLRYPKLFGKIRRFEDLRTVLDMYEG